MAQKRRRDKRKPKLKGEVQLIEQTQHTDFKQIKTVNVKRCNN